MNAHNDLGNRGETIACTHLQKNGYRILERNWRFERAEIDIIAEDTDFLIIVEVKTRSTDFFGVPEEFVDIRKQNLLIRAAEAYIERTGSEMEVRFDIISIILDPSRPGHQRIQHITDAFSAFG